MTKEEELLTLWQDQKPIHRAWGNFVTFTIIQALKSAIAPKSTDEFLRTYVRPRLKDDQKLVEKAFYRKKAYRDPLAEITDKVGTRFVVLLGSDIPIVAEVIEAIPGWTKSKDRDYEKEQNENPDSFAYAAVHYIVRPDSDLDYDGIRIPADTPCEVQIKTLLQHACSELTHDTIYKPQIQATPKMRRNAAKAMALLEATNDYFEKVAADVNEALAAVRSMTSRLGEIYRGATGIEPRPTVLEGMLLSAFEVSSGEGYEAEIKHLLAERPFIVDQIRSRASSGNPIFTQPAVLLAYLAIARSHRTAISAWPLTDDEIEPLLNDLGESRH